jgi:hypothetical protein
MKTLKNLMKMSVITLCMINAACNDAQNMEYGFENEPYIEAAIYSDIGGENRYGDFQETRQGQAPKSQVNINQSMDARMQGRESYQGQNGRLKLFPSVNPKTGQVESYIPLPAGWKVDYTTWTGPNGQSVKFLGSKIYSDMQKRFNSIDDLIQQEIKPQIYSNYRVDRIIPLKEIAMKDATVTAKYFKLAPTNDLSQVSGIEATNMDNGDRAIMIVHFMSSQGSFGTNYMYWVHLLESKARDFEEAKAITINALSTYQENDQAIARHNQKEQSKLAANDRAFQGKMKNRWDNFDASQARAKTYSDMMDSSHESYMDRSRASDYGQSRNVDAILGQETVNNPFDGREVNMESGYDNYYMNTWGEYIGTNDQFYDPNMDSNINNQEWRKVDPR